MTYDTNNIWRCYEIKISKSDFHSKAKHTFIGNFNYFVMPHELYEEVKDEIPKHIGVYCGTGLYKKAKKQELLVDEKILKDSMIRSLYREFEKQYKSADDTLVEKYQRKFNRLKRERDNYYKKYIEFSNGTYEEKELLRFALKQLNMTKTELEDKYFGKDN